MDVRLVISSMISPSPPPLKSSSKIDMEKKIESIKILEIFMHEFLSELTFTNLTKTHYNWNSNKKETGT